MKLILATNEGKTVETFDDIDKYDVDEPGRDSAALAVRILQAIRAYRRKKTHSFPAVRD